MTDPYTILGVSRDISDDELTKRYRTLARQYHPDLHPGDKNAELKMKEINAAYEQIQAIKSGKAHDIGADTDSSGNSGQNYNPYSDFTDFNTYTGQRRYYRSYYNPRSYRQPSYGFNIFRIPIVRIVVAILVIRFVLLGLSMLFGGFSAPVYYGNYMQIQTSYETEVI